MVERQACRARVVSVGLLALLCASGVPAPASEWICTDGNYSNALCWSPPGMPSGENVTVEIPAGKGTITLNVSAGANTLWLYENTTLRIPAGTIYRVSNQAALYGIIDTRGGDFHALKAYVDGTIQASAGTVTVEQADIYGIIDANGGNFTAASATLHGDKALVRVRRGGKVTIPAGVYSAVGSKQSGTLMLSEGTNSLLDLSAVTELNDGFSAGKGGEITHAITARDRGVIDLSGLTTLIGPSEHNTLTFQVSSGGDIRLDRLARISTANTNGRGTVWFEPDGPGVDVRLPALVSLSSTEVHATNGARLTAAGSASSGSFVYSATDANVGDWDYELLSADTGSVLDLSALAELDDGFSNPSYKNRTHMIVAANGGKVLLSGLKRIVGPGDDEVLSIQATSGGRIELSALKTITGGTGSVHFELDRQGVISLGDVTVDAVTNITLRDGSTLEAKALRATKAMTITLNGGSCLRLEHLEATKAGTIAITLNDPRDRLVIENDFELDARIAIFNPGGARLTLRGDFTRTHNGEPGLDLGASRLYFAGQGPQELEVGGWDIGTTTKTDRGSKVIHDLLNGNFGFGRMVVGQPDQPTAVLLADYIDNGNRYRFAGDLYPEALYLFGGAEPNDPNGLRIEKGSTFYMGGLRVYAMLHGRLTDLSTLFEPNQVVIHGFPDGGGDLHLGRPDVNDCRNVVRNGGFESGINPPTWADSLRPVFSGAIDLAPWEIAQNSVNWTHEARFTDAGAGQRWADLSSTLPGQRILRQKIHTRVGSSYHVWFDVAPNPYGPKKSGSVTVRADGSDSTPERFDLAPTGLVGPAPAGGRPWPVRWETKTWRFTARGGTTTVEFAAGDDAGTALGLALDNVIVLSPDANYPPDCFRLADDWFLDADTGIDPNDKLTNDTTPELIFPFTKPVWGTEDGITIEGPAGPLPKSISGWNSDILKVTFPAPLLKEGRYTVTLKNTILDTLGEFLNGGARHTTLSFTLDTTAPAAHVDASRTRNTRPPLTGQVDDPDAPVEVAVAGQTCPAVNNGDGTWMLPANTIQPPLADGEYNVNLAATDRAGNIGSGNGRLIVDTRPPVVAVDFLFTRDPTPSLMGRVDDPNAMVEVTVAGKTYPAQNRRDGTWTVPDNAIDPPLAQGIHAVKAAATDRAGNAGFSSGSVVLDITAPLAGVDALLTRDTTPRLTGKIDDPNATIAVTVAGKTYAARNNGDGTWMLPDNTIDLPLPDGVHEVKVAATDLVGNVGSLTAKALTVDTTPPVAHVEALLTRDTKPPLTGRVDDLDAQVAVIVAGKTYPAVNHGDGTWTLVDNTIDPPLAHGIHEVKAVATDRAGNAGSGSGRLIVDTQPPVVSVGFLFTRDPTPSLTGRVDDPDAAVEVTVAGKTYPAQNRRDGTWTLPDNAIDPPLTDGSHEVKIAATDGAGNVGHGSGSLTLDLTAPRAGVDALLTRDTTPRLTGKVDDPNATVAVTVAGKTYAARNNRDGTWTLPDNTIDPRLPDGVHEVEVAATDPLGNVGTITAKALTVDTTAPVITPQYMSTPERSPELTGAIDDPQAVVTVTVDGTTYTAANDGKGTWQLAAGTIQPRLDSGETYDVTVTATDPVGNVRTVHWRVDIDGP